MPNECRCNPCIRIAAALGRDVVCGTVTAQCRPGSVSIEHHSGETENILIHMGNEEWSVVRLYT